MTSKTWKSRLLLHGACFTSLQTESFDLFLTWNRKEFLQFLGLLKELWNRRYFFSVILAYSTPERALHAPRTANEKLINDARRSRRLPQITACSPRPRTQAAGIEHVRRSNFISGYSTFLSFVRRVITALDIFVKALFIGSEPGEANGSLG